VTPGAGSTLAALVGADALTPLASAAAPLIAVRGVSVPAVSGLERAAAGGLVALADPATATGASWRAAGLLPAAALVAASGARGLG
jgi:hypothetical protein